MSLHLITEPVNTPRRKYACDRTFLVVSVCRLSVHTSFLQRPIQSYLSSQCEVRNLPSQRSQDLWAYYHLHNTKLGRSGKTKSALMIIEEFHATPVTSFLFYFLLYFQGFSATGLAMTYPRKQLNGF